LSKKKFRKSVESIRQQIEIHHQKIENEQKKVVPDTNLINYWRKEITGLEKSLARAEKRLRRGT
jgi:peptidoglycan hydrolase CwlO-like protein